MGCWRPNVSGCQLVSARQQVTRLKKITRSREADEHERALALRAEQLRRTQGAHVSRLLVPFFWRDMADRYAATARGLSVHLWSAQPNRIKDSLARGQAQPLGDFSFARGVCCA